ncbi:unnamed protein product [Schistosoma turkestanicum]|nr:unnamed protein product [Schistosoma turkestanicum]
MLADGEYVDGSWLLSVHIDDLNIDRQIRVHGDWSIGEVISQLTDGLTCPLPNKPLQSNEISLRSNTSKISWADYGLWWPAKSKWLLKTKLSLNQYGLQADAKLRFLSIYGSLSIQLPDLQIRQFVDVNFAEPVFRVTLSICRYLNIRHPEELSLAYPIQQNDLKHSRFAPNYIVDKRYHTLSNTGKRSTFQRSATISTTHGQHNKTLRKESLFQINENSQVKNDYLSSEEKKNSISSRHSIHLFGPPIIRDKRRVHANCHVTTNRYSYPNAETFCQLTYSPVTFDFRLLNDSTLAFSPQIHVNDALHNGYIVRPINFLQRVRLQTIWLDSSKSLLEQGINKLDSNLNLNSPPINTTTNNHNRSNSVVLTGNKRIDDDDDQKANVADVDEQQEVEEQKKKGELTPKLMLRFKYGTFYDLNIKYDLIRINQLYEQAKWSIISEIYEVTDEEACLFAALQSQIELATEHEALMNDENLLNNNNEQEFNVDEQQNNDTTDQQLIQCFQDKTIIDHCKTNMKKIKSTQRLHNRDISPLGGYLHNNTMLNQQYYCGKSISRPLSIAELDDQIDSMLNELSMNCLENIDDTTDTTIKMKHCSRLNEQRPSSLLSDVQDLNTIEQTTTSNHIDEPLPKLMSYVKICKPRKFGLKKLFRRYFMLIKEMELFIYKNKEDYESNSHLNEVIYLPGCEIQSDLCITTDKYNIRLFIPVTRTNLPLSTAFNGNNHHQHHDINTLQTNNTEHLTNKLKRRASLLSLTSLSQLSNAIGLSTSTNHDTSNGLIGLNAIGALTGPCASMTGLMNELWLQFLSLDDFIDWLTIFRITTTANHSWMMTTTTTSTTPTPCVDFSTDETIKKSTMKRKPANHQSTSQLFSRKTFNNERKAILNLVKLLSPPNKFRQFNETQKKAITNITKLYNYLEKKQLINLLPLRLGYLKIGQKLWDHTNEIGFNRSASLRIHEKPPIVGHHTQTNQLIQTRNNFIQHISLIYTQIEHLTSLQTKLKYINAWEQLHLHGILFFTARIQITVPMNSLFQSEHSPLHENTNQNSNNKQTNWMPGIVQRSITTPTQTTPTPTTTPTTGNHVTISISRKLDAIGISATRIYRCDLTNGEILASWRMSSIQSWHINWELNEMVLNLACASKTHSNAATTTTNTTNNNKTSSISSSNKSNELSGRVIIRPIDISIRTVAEFLGGYTFLNLRSPEKNQCLAEDIFYKLTTGISQPSV